MLLKRTILDGIADGRISLVFRRWRRPTVKKGGTLNTAIGVLAIDDIALIDARAIADQDSIQAGYATLAALKAELSKRTELPHRRPSGRRRSAHRIACRQSAQRRGFRGYPGQTGAAGPGISVDIAHARCDRRVSDHARGRPGSDVRAGDGGIQGQGPQA
jgi:hypothetical protein